MSDTDNTDEENFLDAKNSHSDSSIEDETPSVWQPPSAMSQTMQKRMEQFDKSGADRNPTVGQNIDSSFVTSLGRVSGKSEKTPPPVPKKTFEHPEQMNLSDTADSQSQVEMRKKSNDDHTHSRISVKERALIFENAQNQNQSSISTKDRRQAEIHDVQQSPEKDSEVSTVDHSDFEPQFEGGTGSVDTEDIVIGDINDSEDNGQTKLNEENLDPNVTSSGMQKEHQDQQREERSSPRPHTPKSHYPAHGWLVQGNLWPGTEPAPDSQNPYSPRQPHRHLPPYHRGMPTPGPNDNRPPSHLDYLLPDPSMPPYGPYPRFPMSPPGFPPYQTPSGNRMPPYPHGRGNFPHQFGPGNIQYHTGPRIMQYPAGSGNTGVSYAPEGQGQRAPDQYQPPNQQPPAQQGPPKKQTKPNKVSGKQVPAGKEGHSQDKKPRQEASNTRAPGNNVPGGKSKPQGGKDSSNDKGPKAGITKASPSKQGPEKNYLCVSGIDEQQSNDTLFNYLEAKSKMEIIFHESLRTEDERDHAIVVFEDLIDKEKLASVCKKRCLGSSSLEFDEIDPPRSVVASSEDEKFTDEMFKEYLTKKKKHDIARVSTTSDGAVTAKLKQASGVSEILKDPTVTINGCKVTISVMYNCDHGTYWDKSLHTVSIPVPYKPSVNDDHIKSFIIDIQSVCNEHLEQHHARLILKDELHIECTIQPKDKDARQKVKIWKDSVQKAWEEFVKVNAKKRELQVTNEIKELMIEHVNNSKQKHETETLKVISPDETGSMKFIFVGQSTVVENFHEQVTSKKSEFEEKQKRKNRIKPASMDIKPLEVALMKKDNELEKLCEIAEDFSFEADEENGKINFSGVEEDIQKARVKVYEIKNNYSTFRIDTLSSSQCKLLESSDVSQLVNEEFSKSNINLVFRVENGFVMVCSTNENQRQIENVFKGTVAEESIVLDAASEVVLTSGEWLEKKGNLEESFNGCAVIDDSAGNRIVVTSTKDTVDLIKEDLQEFIKEHSVYEDEIKVQDESIFKFLKLHHVDWFKNLIFDNSDQNIEIKYDQNPIEVKGTKTAIDKAKSEIKKEINKIKSDNYSISKPGVDLLFTDTAKSDSITNPVEEDSRTVITVGQSSGKHGAFHRRSGPKQSDEDYANNQAFKSYRRDTKHRKGDRGKPLNSGPVVCTNNTTITLIKKEDIANQKADVIVCSTNGQLDMSGPAGKSLVRGAGTQLLDDIKSDYSDGIQHGDIAVVQGYNLKCQEVYLAALPSFSPGAEKWIIQCVEKCLQQASGYSSIVFPAFGTGNFHYPRDLVARKIYECVSQFDGQNTSLKDIKILVYDDDTIKAFEQEELRQLNPGYRPQTVGFRASSGPYKKNSITVKLEKGDLGVQKLEVLVSAVPKDINLESAGGAGISLMKGLGQGIQQDIANQHPMGVSSGGFAAVKLSVPSGTCKFVYLSSLDSWDGQKKILKDDDKQICKFVYQCLETAEKNGCTSIGIPAMGTGKIGYPHDLVATYMYRMAEKFATNYTNSKLRDIRFVLHPKDHRTVKAFEAEEKKWVPKVQVKTAPPKFAADDSGSQGDKVVPKPISDHEFKVGDVKLTVEQGDILSKNCDAIVNGCSDNFDFNGAVSQAIKNKCDAKKLDGECSKKKDDMKKFGVACTSSCGLSNCKRIIHITTKNSLHGWKKVIKEALKKAEKRQLGSITFPALGTGSEEQMGQTIMEALAEFVSEKKPVNLQQVYLVIFQDKMVKNMLKGVRSGGQSAAAGYKGAQKVVKSEDKNRSSMSFTIYYLSKEHFTRAKDLLDEAIKDKYKTEIVCDSILREAKDAEIDFLMSVGDKYAITFTIDSTKGEVILDGVLDEVMGAKQDVFDAVRKFNHARHCKAEAAIIQEQVQWYLKDTGPTGLPELIPYPDMVNMYLETAYKGESGRTEVEFKDAQGEDYVIVLKEMTEYLKKDKSNKVDVIRREKIQGGAGNTEAPPEWDDQGTESVKVVTLLNSSPEYKSVEKKFIDSVFSGRKEWATQFNKQTLAVTKIERIQNLNLWRMYAAKRDLIEKQNPSGTQNEKELWHGTPEAAVVSINFYGFNRSYCRDNSKDAYWGEGVYFSADASYSARSWLAAGTGGHALTGEHNIYLCKVLTGVTMKGQRNMRYLPIRQDGTMLNYDAATDANYNPTVEYVIFNDTQAYPQYRIKFKY